MKNTLRKSITAVCLFATPILAIADTVPAKPGTFLQEVSRHWTPAPSKSVERIFVENNGAILAGTDRGVTRYNNGQWTADGPSTRIQPNDPMKREDERRERFRARVNDILGIALQPADINEIAAYSNGRLIGACVQGIFHETPDGSVRPLVIVDELGRQWGHADVRTVAIDAEDTLWVGTPAGIAAKRGDNWTFYTGDDGLPYADFTCSAAAPDGSVWFGTTLGLVRFDGQEWHYRQGPRWLPGDDVRDIAIDRQGNAWLATDNGVGNIRRVPMTLAQKAAHYEEQVEKYIKRTPFGYTSEVHVPTPGILPSDPAEIHKSDSDNDGLWTAMYGAGECFAYAATGDPKAKERAKSAFEALRFLQKVTQGGEHSPPKGYVARTILPADGPDPNIGRIERDRESQKSDGLWKAYEPRWPKSADGEWYWKSDTSSDELDGHYFFYPLYHDLVADTEAEKERVREVIRDLTDHLVAHDFQLIDIDGTVTRWGQYSPSALNHDKRWWIERGLNSLSMLSYLETTQHVTGDPKYGEIAQRLIDEHAYDMNAMVPKIQFGVGSGNQSDDEMAFMSFYNLIRYTKNEALREKMQYSFFLYWRMELPEMNPFFNFAYAACGTDATFTSQWGTTNLDPWDGWLDDSMDTLLGFPLDRLNWPHQNSHRLDIVPLRRQQAIDPDDHAPPRRGHRVNGKVLPVENRHFNHWNTDPWRLDYGGNGRTLGNGAVFLLPYYMGLYHGFIEE